MNTSNLLNLTNDLVALARQEQYEVEPSPSPEINGSFGFREILLIIAGVAFTVIILLIVIARLRGSRLSRQQEEVDTPTQAPADFSAQPSQPYQGYRPPRGQSAAAPEPHSQYQSYI